jgi:general secretion pathway protein K
VRQPTLQRKQQGVALITAILIVTIATLIATNMVWDQYLQMRRTESMLAQEQALLYALGAESIAINLLIEDRQSVDDIDHLEEDLLKEQLVAELDEAGSLVGSLVDLQGRFNINNIYRNGQVDQIVLDQFIRLLEILELDAQLADGLIDWVDPDQDVCCAAGAEDETYTSLNPSYRAANRYLTSTSELLAIQGFDLDSYRALEPYIAALPPGWCGGGEFTPINVNTASEQVLLALDLNVAEGNVDQWVAERKEVDGYQDLAAFAGVVDPALIDGNYLSLNSECFGATAVITIGSFRYSMYSLLDRDGKVGVVIPRVRYFGVY